MTSTVDVKDDSRNRPIQKAKVTYFSCMKSNSVASASAYHFLILIYCYGQIEIVLGKTEKFDELMAAAEEEREAAKAEEQS